MNTSNHVRRITLARRPQGSPVPEDFKTVVESMPQVRDGEVLLQTLYLSLDPYMRGRMSDLPSYVQPIAIGETMCGQTVARVQESKRPDFATGELVLANSGWQSHALSTGEGLVKLDPTLKQVTYSLGVLGMPGFTAYCALLDIGKPKSGETVVVVAATGAVGSVVGQIAKLLGCRAVGIAGGPEKCRYAVEHLGFDVCIDHRSEDFAALLASACPKGIDVYFESAGGACMDAALPLLNLNARVPLIGLSAYYNMTNLPTGVDKLPLLLRQILVNRVTVTGFIVFDHFGARQADFMRDMGGWIGEGKVKYREDILQGLDLAPGGLIGMLKGDNFGKLIVKVYDG